jgi:hypothetical protein
MPLISRENFCEQIVGAAASFLQTRSPISAGRRTKILGEAMNSNVRLGLRSFDMFFTIDPRWFVYE